MLLSYTFQIKSWFINSFTDSWRAILMNLKDESHSANRRLVASPGFLTRGGRQEKEPTKGCTGQGWTNDHIAIIFLTLKMFSQKSYSTIMIIEIRWYNSEVIYLSVISMWFEVIWLAKVQGWWLALGMQVLLSWTDLLLKWYIELWK